MTGKPTPGPWRYDENGYLRGSDGSFIGAFHEGRNDRRQRAVPRKVDRTLIVAAPELLETLKRFIAAIGRDAFDPPGDESPTLAEVIVEADTLLDRLTKKGDTDAG